jgi:large subunit ribosomal protein L30
MKNTSNTIRVRWVRSAIGFTHRQKLMVKSLGLRRLHHVVELPDTPGVRGLVSSIPHLVEIVRPTPKPGWFSIPEYSIRAPESHPPEEPAQQSELSSGEAPLPVPSEAEAVEKPPELTSLDESAS